MKFAYITSDLFFRHETGQHPENPQRLTVINRAVEQMIPRSQWIEPRDAAREEIAAIHTDKHIDHVRRSCEEGVFGLDLDTPISDQSYVAAVRAAGAGCLAVEMIKEGKTTRAFCAVRPPGHHAESDRAMGFCLFNNIAIAAKHARRLGYEKVAIVDFDVHHGNGTQHSFYDDPSVLFISFHQWGIYPGTGHGSETGRGDAAGATLNIPLQGFTEDETYLNEAEGKAVPALREFKPDIILVSAGFDAHYSDPIGGMRMSNEGYRELTEILVDAAEELCEGRMVSFLEGGYNLDELGGAVAEHISALME